MMCWKGGLQYEAKLILRFISVDKYFTLDELNYRISNFEYGYVDSNNRPSPITHATLTNGDHSLKQNGE